MIRTLEDTFLELNEPFGIYARSNHGEERQRVLLALRTCFWLIGDKYTSVVACQVDFEKRLTERTWADLQQFVRWADLSQDSIHGVLVFLTIRGLGKSKEFLRLCAPSSRRQPEFAVAHAMTELPDLLPSLRKLSHDMYVMVQACLNIAARFNFSQLVQGENNPKSISSLQAAVAVHGSESVKFYLFALVCMMCGLTGTTTLDGSLFLTEQNAQTLLLGIQSLKMLETADPRVIYWSYIASRANMMDLPYGRPEELVFARLLCMTRTQDKESITIVQDAWRRLTDTERAQIVECFLASGLDSQCFLFTFLPLYFENASKNTFIGLHGALVVILKVLEKVSALEACSATSSVTTFVITVDLHHVASLVTVVKSVVDLEECIDHAAILQSGNRVTVVMTSKSWQAATGTSKDANTVEDAARLIKHMNRRQDALGADIVEILSLARLSALRSNRHEDDLYIANEDLQRPYQCGSLGRSP